MGVAQFGSGLHSVFSLQQLSIGRVLYTCMLRWYANLALSIYGIHQKCSGLARSRRIELKIFCDSFRSKGAYLGVRSRIFTSGVYYDIPNNFLSPHNSTFLRYLEVRQKSFERGILIRFQIINTSTLAPFLLHRSHIHTAEKRVIRDDVLNFKKGPGSHPRRCLEFQEGTLESALT